MKRKNPNGVNASTWFSGMSFTGANRSPMPDRQYVANENWAAVNDAVILIDDVLSRIARYEEGYLVLLRAKDHLLKRLRTLVKWELQ